MYKCIKLCVKKKNYPKEKKKRMANKRKGVIPKGASMNQTKGPMQGAAWIEDIVKKKPQNCTIISAYMNI